VIDPFHLATGLSPLIYSAIPFKIVVNGLLKGKVTSSAFFYFDVFVMVSKLVHFPFFIIYIDGPSLG